MTVYIGDDPALPLEHWCAEPTYCIECSHKWVAVYPLGADDLECPQCNSTDTVRGDEDDHPNP